jgi:hypothetical protein
MEERKKVGEAIEVARWRNGRERESCSKKHFYMLLSVHKQSEIPKSTLFCVLSEGGDGGYQRQGLMLVVKLSPRFPSSKTYSTLLRAREKSPLTLTSN